MSKMYNDYLMFKKQNNEYWYIFKKASKLLTLKLTKLNDEVLKCGFPIGSLEKYINLINENNIKVKIIDNE